VPHALLLAHQGGWDEILLVLTPISLFAALLWLANRRANAELQRRAEAPDDDGEPPVSPS
jgi:cyanate permease